MTVVEDQRQRGASGPNLADFRPPETSAASFDAPLIHSRLHANKVVLGLLDTVHVESALELREQLEDAGIAERQNLRQEHARHPPEVCEDPALFSFPCT